ncbi:MAG: four-helix bundle copper-binding protein [Proteobacteria bacterium]|nr:four-helix bundle copper-binding protein [Pseudomonadota bacterium]
MIYKNCIDACFECVKACERCACEGYKTSKECTSAHDLATTCADICALVGRLTAKGLCCSDLYELCANYCEDCARKCEKIDHEYAKACAAAAKKCAEACRQCQADCEKCDNTKKVCG